MISKYRWLTDETGYPLRSIILSISSRSHSPRAYDTRHVPLQTLARCITVRVSRATWMQNTNLLFHCEKCPLRKCGEVKKPVGQIFRLLFWVAHIHLCAHVPIVPPVKALCLPRPPPRYFNEMFKRAYVKYPSRNLLTFECWKHSLFNGNWDYYYSSCFLRSRKQ